MARRTISLSLEPGVVERIDWYAEREGINRSEAIARLCGAALDALAVESGREEFFRMTGPGERVREVLVETRVLEGGNGEAIECIVRRCGVREGERHNWK